MMDLENKGCAGTSRRDTMDCLETGLNVGMYKLEQAVFMLDDLSRMFESNDAETDVSGGKIVRLLMDANKARVLIGIARDSIHEAFSSFQDADKSFGTLFELDRRENALDKCVGQE